MGFTTNQILGLGQAAQAGNAQQFFKECERGASPSRRRRARFEPIVANVESIKQPSTAMMAMVDGMIPGFSVEIPDQLGLDDLEVRVGDSPNWYMRPTFRWSDVDNKWDKIWIDTANKVQVLPPDERQDVFSGLSYAQGAWNYLIPGRWQSYSKELCSPKLLRPMVSRAMQAISEIADPQLRAMAMKTLGGAWKAALQSRRADMAVQFLPNMTHILVSPDSDSVKLENLAGMCSRMVEQLRHEAAFEIEEASRDFADPAVRSLGEEPPVPPPPKGQTPKASGGPPPAPPLSSARYADYVFYRDRTKKPPLRVGKSEPLRVKKKYFLEVAIRFKAKGIPTKGERKELPTPKQSEPVTIWVTLESEVDSHFNIEKHIQTITLPPDQESTDNAKYELTPLDVNKEAALIVRMYYKMNLLESTIIRAPIVSSTEEKPVDCGVIIVRQYQVTANLNEFDDVKPRHLNIDIGRYGQNAFRLSFFASPPEDETGSSGTEESDEDELDGDEDEIDRTICFTTRADLNEKDLNQELKVARNTWNDIVFRTPYEEELTPKSYHYRDVLRRLAAVGQDLKALLFSKVSKSDLAKVGKWLMENSLPKDSVIQISVEKNSQRFVFPWALIFDGVIEENPRVALNTDGFWGVRYSIEQTLSRYSEVLPSPQTIKLKFLANNEFGIYRAQTKMLDEFKSAAGGSLQASDPITTIDECLEYLQRCDAQILYFCTHGYTKYEQDSSGAVEDLKLFKDLLQRLESDGQHKAKLQELWEEFESGKSDRLKSWIQLGNGKITLKTLRKTVENLKSNPLVILNMCESAQVSATLSDSFVEFFLDRGASSVVGTECSMPLPFVDAFGRFMLKATPD